MLSDYYSGIVYVLCVDLKRERERAIQQNYLCEHDAPLKESEVRNKELW